MRSNSRVPAPRRRSAKPIRWRVLLPLVIPALLIGGWVSAADTLPSILEGFDFSKDGGVQERLPRVLEEVSGLTTTPDGRVLAHNDERAVVYELDPAGNVIKAFAAGIGGARGDFEGIALAGERLFLVTSSGEILETMEGEDDSVVQYRLFPMGLQRLCEFEGLAYDPATGDLLLPCKNTRTKELKDHVVVFSVSVDSLRPYPVPRVFFPYESLVGLGLKDSFHPSGIEVHPETGRWILISAQEESILEISPEGILIGGRELHRKTHPQPEGITFLNDGSLLLADEGQGKRGRLTRYRVQDRNEGGAP
jgi:uncharacterized protein YjiK